MKSPTYILVDKVYFIESLLEGDKSTAEDLRDSILYHRSKPSWFTISEKYVQTKEGLLDCFKKIKSEIESSEVYPLLHLEFHGDKRRKGAILGNNDFISWKEIVNELQEINRLTRFNLIVFIGACFGLESLEFVAPENRAPFFLLVAPHDEIYAYQLRDIYQAFYKELFNTQQLDDGLKALRKVATENNFENISFITSVGYFKLFIEGYAEFSQESSFRENRINRLVSELKNQSSYMDEELLKIWVTINIDKAEREKFRKLENKFFMKDLFPENKERFQI